MKITESEEKTLREEVRQKLGRATIEVRRVGDCLCTLALLPGGYVLSDMVHVEIDSEDRMERLARKLYELEYYAWQLRAYESAGEEEGTEQSKIGSGFGWAVKEMAKGQLVARAGWENRVLLMDREELSSTDVIYEKMKHGEAWRINIWYPTQSDMLASDWVVRA